MLLYTPVLLLAAAVFKLYLLYTQLQRLTDLHFAKDATILRLEEKIARLQVFCVYLMSATKVYEKIFFYSSMLIFYIFDGYKASFEISSASLKYSLFL